MKKILVCTLFCVFIPLALYAISSPLMAINMDSDSYKIQWGNINIGAGQDLEKSGGGSYLLDLTMGQIAPGRYEKTGYLVRAGFQYIHSIIPFSFTISDLSIDFGSLTPQTPSTDTNTLTVSAGGAGGYQVLAIEDHTLRSNQSANISDTVCDGSDCDETSAGVWSQNTTYGFGFNMSGDHIPADFTDSTYFRQFASKELSESAQVVMSSSSAISSATSTVTYKVNTGSTQEAGNYENAITFIAVPSY